jgi:8-oxo-dGTP pyrophosphatase MutT (NUDIX family)
VLLALFEHQQELSLLFIRRASTLRAHSGEIAFPGGSVEPTDASLTETALREAWEEVGLDPGRVEVLGAMSPVFTVVSNFLIAPVVGYLPQGPGELRVQASEVAEIIVAPLAALADPAILRVEHWTRGEQTRTVYFFDYKTYCIWGATGRILYALLSLLDPNDNLPAL